MKYSIVPPRQERFIDGRIYTAGQRYPDTEVVTKKAKKTEQITETAEESNGVLFK